VCTPISSLQSSRASSTASLVTPAASLRARTQRSDRDDAGPAKVQGVEDVDHLMADG
jgi:hypothetical protein